MRRALSLLLIAISVLAAPLTSRECREAAAAIFVSAHVDTIYATADNRLNAGQAGSDHSAVTTTPVGMFTTNKSRLATRFVLSSLPDSAAIDSARGEWVISATTTAGDTLVQFIVNKRVEFGTGAGAPSDTTSGSSWSAFNLNAGPLVDSLWGVAGCTAADSTGHSNWAMTPRQRSYWTRAADSTKDRLKYPIAVSKYDLGQTGVVSFDETYATQAAFSGLLSRRDTLDLLTVKYNEGASSGRVTFFSTDTSTVALKPRLIVYWHDPRDTVTVRGVGSVAGGTTSERGQTRTLTFKYGIGTLTSVQAPVGFTGWRDATIDTNRMAAGGDASAFHKMNFGVEASNWIGVQPGHTRSPANDDSLSLRWVSYFTPQGYLGAYDIPTKVTFRLFKGHNCDSCNDTAATYPLTTPGVFVEGIGSGAVLWTPTVVDSGGVTWMDRNYAGGGTHYAWVQPGAQSQDSSATSQGMMFNPLARYTFKSAAADTAYDRFRYPVASYAYSHDSLVALPAHAPRDLDVSDWMLPVLQGRIPNRGFMTKASKDRITYSGKPALNAKEYGTFGTDEVGYAPEVLVEYKRVQAVKVVGSEGGH